MAPAGQQLLSTDPAAGQTSSSAVLSTDPSAGLSTSKSVAPQPSSGVLSSDPKAGGTSAGPAPTGTSIVKSALPEGGGRLWDMLFGPQSKLEDVKHTLTNLFINDPVEGAQQVARGLQGAWSGKARVKPARDIIEGAGKALTPVAVIGGLFNPIPAIGALVGATGAQKAVDWLGTKAGLNPDRVALAGDLAALAVGTSGFKAGSAISDAVAGSRTVGGFKGWVNPKSASEAGARSGSIIENAKADIENFKDVQSYQALPLEDAWNKIPSDQAIKIQSDFERTGTIPVDVTKKWGLPDLYAPMYKASVDASHDVLEEARGNPVAYVDNYVAHKFKFASSADEARGKAFLVNEVSTGGKQSFSGNKGVFRQRKLDMPIDEALSKMRAEGITVEPVTTNMETLRQWTATNARQHLVYGQAWQALKDEKLISLVKPGQKAPLGFEPLDDKVASVFFPSDKGLVKSGQYYAPPDVAKIMNRAISKGLGSSPTWGPVYNGLRAANNVANQVQLSVPSFHMLDTGLNSMASDLAAGIQDMRGGNYKAAAAKIFRSPAGAAFQFVKGNKVIQALRKGDPAAVDVLEKAVNPGGARLAIDSRFRTQAIEQMYHAFADKKIAKGIALSPLAAVQLLSKPLMEVAIPRVKVGAYLDLVESIKARMPGATEEQLARAYQHAWDSIDNRFGLMTYDNLFWSRAVTDALQLMVRSVGWQYGTLREGGGGLQDVKKLLQGKGATDRLLFTAMLPVAHAITGAVYQYLHTGKGPESVTDYFYPQNGLTDANGQPQRISIPSYVNTGRNYATHPFKTAASAESPLLQWAREAGPWSNENYFGDMIYNPKDGAGDILKQVGEDALSRFVPFPASGVSQLRSQGAPAERQAEGFLGIRNAPADVQKPEFQQKAEDVLHDRLGERHRTPEQVQTDDLKTKARQELKTGKQDALRELIQQGVIKTPAALRAFLQGASRTPFERIWAALSKAERAKLLAGEK